LKPFLVTNLQAGKLPRWLLLLLCTLYTLPGLIARDPWRADDAANFGVGLTMARGQLSDWLLPNLAGLAMPDRGPMAGWIFAIAAKLASLMQGAGMNFMSEHLAVRCATMLLIGAGFTFFWYATYELCSRKGVQPNDPFGVAAHPTELGRALADSSLLILMASFGLIARVHETSADAVQFAWTTLFILGMAFSLERPKIAGWVIGFALSATTLTKGPSLALAMLAAWGGVLLVCTPYRWTLKPIALRALTVLLALVGAWLWAAASSNSDALKLLLSSTKMGAPNLETLKYYGRTFAWFFWPAWPIATWAAWRWRTRLDEPVVALGMSSVLAFSTYAFFHTSNTESALLPLIPALALLAALGLPTLKRVVGSLIDWFAVVSFTVFGFAIWAYWAAYLTGTPAKMAFSVQRLAPGYEPKLVVIEMLFGLMATLAWVGLVRWRLGKHANSLWRPVALSCGGLILTWVLLMTLWLPFFDERNTYRDAALDLNARVKLQDDCVDLGAKPQYQIGTTERASFFYFSKMRFGKTGEKCKFLLLKDDGPEASILNTDEPGWRQVWQGGRKNMRAERFRLYQRKL
jgi:4-amino-4-deoxy-L-arabinose transferase-like glycosyltransferase